MKRTSLTRRKRLSRVSRKLRAGKSAYDAVYAAVDARSGGRCERTWTSIVAPHTQIIRCPYAAIDHHHCRTPRRSNHHAHLIVALCRGCHELCAGSYRDGRLVVTPRGDGTFTFALVTARDKWEARG